MAVNGVDTAQWEEARRATTSTDPNLDSERNLSWTAVLPANNRIEAGEWWDEQPDEPAVSLEEAYATSAGIKVGDVISFDIGGLPVDARVASIRRVEWDSMAPNFFILFSPGALQDVPATYMTSFYLAPQEKAFLNRLLAAFPTVTVIEVDKVIAQIQSIVGRVTQAVQLVLSLVLVAGCLVLIASIQASGEERLREHALLRGARCVAAAGARRARAPSSRCSAFSPGLIAAFGAEVTVFALDKQVFELSPQLHPWVWLAGPLIGGAVVCGIGLFGTRALVGSPPVMVLRELG